MEAFEYIDKDWTFAAIITGMLAKDGIARLPVFFVLELSGLQIATMSFRITTMFQKHWHWKAHVDMKSEQLLYLTTFGMSCYYSYV